MQLPIRARYDRDLRIVVCSVLAERGPFQLPASQFGTRPRIAGGERTLYELATALAVAGFGVELRGDLAEPVFRAITDAAGAAPAVDLPPRVPEPDDVVVLCDGEAEVELYGAVALSGARGVVMMLGPPGQYGWNFIDPIEPRDLLTFSLDSVARPEHFRAMRDLGFELWTNSPGLAAAANSAGAPCTSLGTGNPEGFPDLVEKTHDLAVIRDNKWTPLAREVLEVLPELSCLEIGDQGHRTLAEELGRARVLVWPSRREGDSRIQREARAMGTVPVALSSNPFAAGLDDDGGAVLVDELADMPGAIRRLLANHEELTARSQRAVEQSRSWAAWEPYVDRVHDAVSSLSPPRDGHAAMTVLGAELVRVHTAQQARIDELGREVRDKDQRIDELVPRVESLANRVAKLEALVRAYRERKIVRIADGLLGRALSRRQRTSPN